MGVKDLWQLLGPIGRKVSMESLERKVLAIDVSIWITQFIKAMRDDEGNMVQNAHILGTLRRILKLLYHRIKPVFVFDGATPKLKERTVQQRRNKRKSTEDSHQKNTKKLFMAMLKKEMLSAELARAEGAGGAAGADKAAAVAEGSGNNVEGFAPYDPTLQFAASSNPSTAPSSSARTAAPSAASAASAASAEGVDWVDASDDEDDGRHRRKSLRWDEDEDEDED